MNKELVPSPSSRTLVKRGLDDLSLASRGPSKTIRVPEDCPDLECAVRQASPSEVIDLAPGTYTVNIVLDKALTIRGRSPGAVLLARDPSQPICRVLASQGTVVVRGIGVEGKAEPHAIKGIELADGHLSIDSCQFDGFPQVLLDDDSVVDSCAIKGKGPDTRLQVDHCTFRDCWPGIAISDGADLALSGSMFMEGCSALGISGGGHAELRHNLLKGCEFGAWIGGGSHLSSEYDTFERLVWAFYPTYGDRPNVAHFKHATIRCRWLASVHYGIVHGPPIIPTLVFSNSIVQFECPDVPARHSAFGAGVPSRELNLLDLVPPAQTNLFFCPPLFPGPDPMLGELKDNQLPLMAGSPAAGAASDGTNLGAWQGEVE